MLSRISLDLLKLAQKLQPVCYFSSSKISSQRGQAKKDFMVELATPCETDKILCFVEEHFMAEEPLYRALIPGKKPEIVRQLFRGALDHKVSLVARNCCDKKIVGVAINDRSGKLDGAKLAKMTEKIEDPQLKKLFQVWTVITQEPKINEKLCQDELFHLAVLSVAESHYGKGIGLELVKKSLELARDRNFQYAKMNCTSDNTRKIAEKLGMKRFWAKPYREIMCQGIMPRALPEPPHNCAKVYFIDLQTLPKC